MSIELYTSLIVSIRGQILLYSSNKSQIIVIIKVDMKLVILDSDDVLVDTRNRLNKIV